MAPQQIKHLKGGKMKALTKLLVVTGLLLAGSVASAKPTWLCAMNFNGVSKGFQVVLGKSSFEGRGTINCQSFLTGEKQQLPILVSMKTAPIAPRISLGKMNVYGEALSINLNSESPEALLGNYYVATGRIAWAAGVGVLTAVHSADQNLSLKVSLQALTGAGLELGFSKLTVSLDESRLQH